MNTYHPPLLALILLILGLVSLITALFFHRRKIEKEKSGQNLTALTSYYALTTYFMMAGIVFLLCALLSIFIKGFRI